MNIEKKLIEIMEEDVIEKVKYEKELKEICENSKRITYQNMIDKLKEITENKINGSFKFTSFVGWLVEDLEFCKMVNEENWDMTIEEIEAEYKSMEEWEKEYNELKNEDNFNFKNVEEYKDCMLDWSYSNCLDSIFDGLKNEFENRKNKGMI